MAMVKLGFCDDTQNKQQSTSVDIWGLGVLTFEFLHGGPPFEGDDQDQTLAQIRQVKYKFPNYFSPEACDFIAKVCNALFTFSLLQLLKLSPAERMSLKDVPSHPWIKNNVPK